MPLCKPSRWENSEQVEQVEQFEQVLNCLDSPEHVYHYYGKNAYPVSLYLMARESRDLAIKFAY